MILAGLSTICVVIGTAAGPRAGLTAAALLIGLPCAGGAVLAALCLAADAVRTARHRRAFHRAGLDQIDPRSIADQAHTHLARRLDQEA
ncbi:hypothetical protein [Streptomyces sp. IBSBF 2435]|uniref:hypothetical protein n=1 Tax=Streptomyces sp. IBSBF 2435 TaxID=2903531 RepID=UPI002FDBFDF5